MPPFKLPSRSVLPVRPIGTARSRLAISPRRSILTALLAALTLGALASAPAALASHGEAVYFEGSTDLLSPVTRPHAIAQMQALGVTALRVELSWYDVAPGQKSATKPSFEATNPASYSWGEYDALINEAARLHWKVLLTVTSPVPRWATSNKAAPYVTSPDDQDFEQFMTAVARHYGSSVALRDLERAQPPRVPAPAVQLARTARLAAGLSRAVPGRLRGPAGRRARASAGADGRNRAVRL